MHLFFVNLTPKMMMNDVRIFFKKTGYSGLPSICRCFFLKKAWLKFGSPAGFTFLGNIYSRLLQAQAWFQQLGGINIF